MHSWKMKKEDIYTTGKEQHASKNDGFFSGGGADCWFDAAGYTVYTPRLLNTI